MCTRKSVTERLKIMENAGMISEKVAVFCTSAAGMILKEKGDADEEKLNMFITHLPWRQIEWKKEMTMRFR